MQIEIISPEKKIFQGETDLVQMPGVDGSFEILHNHAPMIAALGIGRIKIENPDKTIQYFDIHGGVVEILNNKILILAD